MIDFIDAAEALAKEMDLLGKVSQNPDENHLWFWESPRCLVAPKRLATKPQFEQASRSLLSEGWPVNLRSTGGDVTPQGTGILNVTHVYSTRPGEPVNLAREYDRLCSPIEQTLGPGASRGWRPGAFCDGEYNVQLDNLKFAGTAMRIRRCRTDRIRNAILAHAIMLVDPVSAEAIEAINRFLDLLGETRRIDIGAHTSLPRSLSKEVFVSNLSEAFQMQAERGPYR